MIESHRWLMVNISGCQPLFVTTVNDNSLLKLKTARPIPEQKIAIICGNEKGEWYLETWTRDLAEQRWDLCCKPEKAVEQRAELILIWDVIAHMWCPCNMIKRYRRRNVVFLRNWPSIQLSLDVWCLVRGLCNRHIRMKPDRILVSPTYINIATHVKMAIRKYFIGASVQLNLLNGGLPT